MSNFSALNAEKQRLSGAGTAGKLQLNTHALAVDSQGLTKGF